MILIFSIAGDPCTSEVIRWLHHLGQRHVLRINEEEIKSGRLRVDVIEHRAWLSCGGLRIATDDVSAVWYRKGTFNLFPPHPAPRMPEHGALEVRLESKIRLEGERISEYVHHLLAKSARRLGHAKIGALNKLVVLDAAREVGLHVPGSVASDSRDTFVRMLAGGIGAVSKASFDGMYLWDYDVAQRGYFSYTERLDQTRLDALPERIPPSFAQYEIRKRFEVRSFFLDGAFHSLAIFSQNDAKTSLDYRKYNYERPNRNVPYMLPDDVRDKITRLFERLSLNTGSVDLIVDERGEHVFLEINPSGQYDILSKACNRNIDKHVALWLMDAHEDRTGTH